MQQGDPSNVVAVFACREMPTPTLHMQAANRPVFAKGEEVQLKRIATILESRPLALVETSRITMCELVSLENGTKVWRIFSESCRNQGERSFMQTWITTKGQAHQTGK